jgi:hypothetical protein
LGNQTLRKPLFLRHFVTSAPRLLPRIVSLVPSITELLFDLGLGDYLVGRTGFCIHPADSVAQIAKVGGTKSVNLAKIKKLAPTHVIVNVDENEWPTVQALQQFVPHVIVTHPQTSLDNLALIDQLLDMAASFAIDSIAASALFERANELKHLIKARIEHLSRAVQAPERVLYLIWRDPWMTVARDTYISRMLALIGWHTWPAVQGGEKGAARYPLLLGDEPWLRDVQRVLLSSEPYRFGDEHLIEVQRWLPDAKVQLVDGELLSWYGSRAAKGLVYLRELADSASATDASADASSA